MAERESGMWVLVQVPLLILTSQLISLDLSLFICKMSGSQTLAFSPHRKGKTPHVSFILIALNF